MAFRQQHRPQSSRQLSYHASDPPAEVGTTSPQRKRPLEESQEWVLFSPVAPSTTARTHTTSTERTPRTAGLSRFSDFGSLDTAARSEQDDDDITCQGTEEGEELDSLDDGLHAFHEPSEYAGPSSRLQQSGDTVLPTHDGLGTFQPNATLQEQMWQFERQTPRRRQARRRSSVQRRLDALEEAEELNHEQDRRQRIEKWRLEQSKALLEEIERETRRRRRMSMVSAARSRTDSAHQDTKSTLSQAARSVSDGQSESSDDSTENLSFWQRLTRRVIRDLMGIDEDTLSVIFGEALPEEALSTTPKALDPRPSMGTALQDLDDSTLADHGWQHRLLERVARELGILVHQLSEHPGAFSTYRLTQEAPEYAGLPTSRSSTTIMTDFSPSATTASGPSAPAPSSAQFAPTFPAQYSSNTYSEASLWGIEEEPEVDPLDSFRTPPGPALNASDELAREQEYWERELDVKMVFNFLVQRFTSRRSSISCTTRRSSSAPASTDNEGASARRAAIIRQHHPLVGRTTDRSTLPTSPAAREGRRRSVYFQHQPSLRNQVLKSSSSCASQSTKKSKRSAGSGRNYWDMGGSVGSGSVIAGEV
ncbi:hypothetical protein BU26DRAFT_522458 [Trematosphaeria pertusa]|uniref:Uncharacterized protein n=1 Tax=Trematosphaeria pertusa TaxID=390896 RepID=A0A6A6I314_9PLEO|nr:uncharacterized protein BU26DRAFT_522458 [Trematosphaeria pertusa]KAF2244656.1 hypothetical protein BU26DRAFT_522458 [Trematosphaeria pertusa]